MERIAATYRYDARRRIYFADNWTNHPLPVKASSKPAVRWRVAVDLRGADATVCVCEEREQARRVATGMFSNTGLRYVVQPVV